MIKRLVSIPKKLFLIDGLGAILSAFLLGVVLVRFESVFGIPVTTLYFLATLPVFFALYDLYSYRKGIDTSAKLLKGIAIINFLYCCISVGFGFFHVKTITLFGWLYIVIEVLIVLFLSVVEYQVAKRLFLKKDT